MIPDADEFEMERCVLLTHARVFEVFDGQDLLRLMLQTPKIRIYKTAYKRREHVINLVIC